MWERIVRKKYKGEERRRRGPEFEQLRKEFDSDKKLATSETLKAAQLQTNNTNSRIESLQRISRLGNIPKR